MMPYVIATKRPLMDPPLRSDGFEIESRRAVATLEGARRTVAMSIPPFGRPYSDALLLPETGGTVGPLPDGTVIEVAQTNWHDLFRASGLALDETAGDGVGRFTADDETKIVDAYNAREVT